MLDWLSKKPKDLTFKNGLWILACVYVVLSISYLVQYHGLPYVFDNNESFSSIIHAKNLINFDFFKSFGLTDESYGVAQSAHPYVYTHQGNFPRLFAALLYLMGIQSIEWQIIAHLVTINTLALYFAYYYFAKKISPLFALIYCLILLTDYVMNFQWQFNTWRVWHCFFMFSSLLLVEKYSVLSKKLIIPLFLLNFACLAYYEIAFSIFVSVTCCLLLIIDFKKINKWTLPISIILIGLAFGFGLLVLQSLLYYGSLSAFLNDFILTFNARNYSLSNPKDRLAEIEKVWEFVSTYHLVFWDNYISIAEKYSSQIIGLQLYLRYNFVIYTPLFILIICIVYFSLIIKFCFKKMENIRLKNFPKKYINFHIGFNLNKVIISLAIFCFSIYIIYFSTLITHIDLSSFRPSKYLYPLILLLLSILVVWNIFKKNDDISDQISSFQVSTTIIFIIVVMVFGIYYKNLFELNYIPYLEYYDLLWRKLVLFSYINSALSKTVFCLTLILGVFLILNEPLYKIPSKGKNVIILFPLLVAGLIGIVTSWLLFPGYIFSAYFTRYAPIYEYLNILVIAIPIYILSITVFRTSIKLVELYYFNNNKIILFRNIILSTPLILVYLFLIISWVFIQINYYTSFKNDSSIIFNKLNKEPYKLASAVSHVYSAPFSVQTGQWSYFDPQFSNGRINRTENGYFYGQDDRFIWLSDKKDNINYKYPDYFICFIQAHYDNVSEFNGGCHDRVPFVRNIMQNNNKNDFSNLMHPKIIDADKSGKDLWAIIKLDNDFPPFLMPHPNQRIVDLEKTARGLKVNYLFRQQLNNPENKTEISLYKLENCNSLERPQLILSSNSSLIEVNKTSGEIFQVSVQPHSATKAGEVYWSEPFKVIEQQITFCGQKSGPISPRNLSVEVGANGRKVELRWQADGDVRHFEIEKSFNGTFFSPLTHIDGQKRDIDMGSLLNSNTQYLRIRSCNDWACSPWNTLHNK